MDQQVFGQQGHAQVVKTACPVSAFYKGESQEKNFAGDRKAQICARLSSPRNVGRLLGFSFFADSCCFRDDVFGF
jgi:hypothetical protein